MYRLGAYVADHVNRASGPKAVAIPLKSLDNYSCEGNQWAGLDIHPMIDPWLEGLDKSIEVLQMDANINDHEFADALYGLFEARWKQYQESKN